MQVTTTPGALDGLRVLDMSRVLAGPWAGQMLADLGADVIKIERPDQGDDTRKWGPPWLKDRDGRDTGDAAYFMCANRNKRSVAADLATEEGQQLIRSLALRADVLIENFKVGGLAQYGLDYESLRAINPKLIYCSISGFGQTGPYAKRPGYDFLIQGMGGLMSVTGRPDTDAGGGPMKVGVALTDVMTGLYASVGILAALAYRDRSGHGQHIDLALLDVQVASLANQASNYLVGGVVPQRLGNAHPNIVPYQDFPTSDGYMILAVGNDTQFERMCQTLGHPEWAEDPRFASNAGRVEHRQVLVPLISLETRQRTTQTWMAEMASAGVPCGPVNTIEQVFSDAQVRDRGMTVSLPHLLSEAVTTVANPIHLSASPVTYRSAPPTIGQHTQQVMADWLHN